MQVWGGRCLARGARKKYTANTLRKAVESYFAGITRDRIVTEPVPTGRLDGYGHPIFEEQPVKNGLGYYVMVTEYLVPPSLGAMTEALGIHRSTWDNWRDKEKYPEFQDVVAWADDRILAWKEEQVLTRPGKNLKGIIWDLDNNHGYYRKRSEEARGGDTDQRAAEKLEDLL